MPSGKLTGVRIINIQFEPVQIRFHLKVLTKPELASNFLYRRLCTMIQINWSRVLWRWQVFFFQRFNPTFHFLFFKRSSKLVGKIVLRHFPDNVCDFRLYLDSPVTFSWIHHAYSYLLLVADDQRRGKVVDSENIYESVSYSPSSTNWLIEFNYENETTAVIHDCVD